MKTQTAVLTIAICCAAVAAFVLGGYNYAKGNMSAPIEPDKAI